MREQRIIKKDLVYLIGIPPSIAQEEKLMQKEFLGQYGRIRKIVINREKPFTDAQTNSVTFSAYITFKNFIEAALAILSIDKCTFDNKTIKASFGMTKYCSFFINN